ncbi:MAG: hypothetical protein ACOY0T_12545 [Myxococcota bacterium]
MMLACRLLDLRWSRPVKPVGSALLIATLAACGSESKSSGTGGSAGQLSQGGASTSSGGTSAGGSAGKDSSGGNANTGSGGSSNASGGNTNAGSANAGSGGNANASSGGATNAGSGGNANASSGGATSGGATNAGSGGGASPCTNFSEPSKVGDIAETALDGPSGIAASRAHAGVLYAHLDAGGGAVVYAMTYAGKALGTYTLMGVTATDWEDMAVAPCASGNCLYIGDIGDNAARTGSGTPRTQIQVLRVAEPDVSSTQATVQQALTGVSVLRFTYPDAPHDAETLMVDPVSRDILILTKETDGNSAIFRAAAATAADTPTVLEKVGNVQVGTAGTQGAQASAGDISPTGDRFILRSYTAILLWPRGQSFAATFAASPTALPSPTEPQGEGLTFSADGKAWLSSGERARAIYQGTASCP